MRRGGRRRAFNQRKMRSSGWGLEGKKQVLLWRGDAVWKGSSVVAAFVRLGCLDQGPQVFFKYPKPNVNITTTHLLELYCFGYPVGYVCVYVNP